MRHVRLLIAFLLLHSAILAQTRNISGSVKDKNGTGIPAVTVKVKGKNIETVTDINGAFSIPAPAGKVTIIVTSVGFAEKSIEVPADQNTISFSMDETKQELGEVVVTALGISKESKKVGYAVSTVGAEQFNKARETNLALSLTGTVAGLNVHGTSGGPGSSARILLRGLPSTTANSPLFVINGVPMDNSQRGSAGEWGGADMGDGIGNLNPDDIESMTVLKGQAASALYGARASNGVIMITTKSGKKGALSVEYNMNLMADKAINYTDYQYQYGQGQYGAKPTTVAEAQMTSRESWGAKLDGSQVIQYDGKTYAYSPFKKNIKNFYRTGPSFTNTVSVTKGTDAGSFRLSLSNLDNQSIVRNSGITRKTINLNIDQKITPKLSVSLMANYIDQQDKNRTYLSDGPLNANNGQFLATNIDERILAPGYDPVTGFETVAFDDIYVTNPYFVLNQLVNNQGRKRLISSVSSRYNLTDWLYAQGRVGYDIEHDRIFSVTPWGTAYTTDEHGGLNNLANSEALELNVDGMIGVNKNITNDLHLDAVIGANQRKNQFEQIGVSGGPFVLPYLYSYNNVVNFGRNYNYYKKEVHSAYYTLDFSYKNYLTLSTTGRYDAYSTVAYSAIPKNKRNIFTPSFTGSFIFSEVAHLPSWLSYGKLRASYAQTSGEPGDPYLTAVYYNIGNTLNGLSTGNFSTSLPNNLLKPFTTTEVEVGTELKFYNNRLGIDVAYYTKKSHNEIMPGTLSSATGYQSNYVATGSTKNSGLELQVTGNPIKQSNLNWNVTFNLTSLKNVIVETDAAGNPITLGTYRPLNANTAFVKGMSGPQIMAYDYTYSSKGEMVVDASGLPVQGKLIPMGSVLPKLYGGLNNEFTYKGVTLSFLIDYNYGNKILSATNYYGIRRGLDKMTLEGRETGVTKGVLANGSTNTTAAKAQDYYMALAQNVSRVNVLNGDYIKLRQATIGYTFSDKNIGKMPLFSAIQISLVGRNLLALMKHSGNIDPEAGFSNIVRYAGIEGTSLPTSRTYGVNVNFKFK